MTNQKIAQTNQQQNSEKPQASGILQRAAVHSVSKARVQSTEDKEVQPLGNSVLSKDFSRVPISTTKPQPIMAKLMIGPVGDKYEQEADRVAEQVVRRINAPASVRSGEDETVQREEMETKDNKARLMRSPILQRRSSDGGMAATPDLEASINQARGGGQPMENHVRKRMEQGFGVDFSGVKIHTDAQSDKLNRSIGARASTIGGHVFFRQGEFNPGSRKGQELIAHELAHMFQSGEKVLRKADYKSDATDYMNEKDPKSEILDDNFDEHIKPELPQPTKDDVVNLAVNKATNEDVILWRSTTGPKVKEMRAAGTAGGAVAQQEEAAPPGKEQIHKQIARGGVVPEFTASSHVTGFSWQHWLVVVRINTKYLARGSSHESGWVCSPGAPVQVLATVDRTCGRPEPAFKGSA